jgi:hypothetical protein
MPGPYVISDVALLQNLVGQAAVVDDDDLGYPI